MGLRQWLNNLLASARAEERLPPPDQGRGPDELAHRLGMRTDDLSGVRPTYNQYTLPKRTGGTRTITAPGGEFKAFQRLLLRRVLARLPVHPTAVGFRKGQSIVTHALTHAFMPVIIKMDIRDFFGTTSYARVHAYFRKIGWNADAARLLVAWCTHEGGLPQGAPTSPLLSNAVNYRMDSRIAGLLAAHTHSGPRRQNPKTLELIRNPSPSKVFYSRYADDLTLSLSEDDAASIHSLIYVIKSIVEDEGYRLHTRKKLRIMRRHDRQTVTGLVVNNGVRLPRETRRWLRAVEHHLATGRRASINENQLQGWRALENMIRSQTHPNEPPAS